MHYRRGVLYSVIRFFYGGGERRGGRTRRLQLPCLARVAVFGISATDVGACLVRSKFMIASHFLWRGRKRHHTKAQRYVSSLSSITVKTTVIHRPKKLKYHTLVEWWWGGSGEHNIQLTTTSALKTEQYNPKQANSTHRLPLEGVLHSTKQLL